MTEKLFSIEYDDDVFSTVGRVVWAIDEILNAAGFTVELDDDLPEDPTDNNYGFNEEGVVFKVILKSTCEGV